jgi:hypothetical protein
LVNYEAEARAFSLSDLPLIQRLKSRGISMDSQSYLSRGLHTAGDATLSRLPLGDFGSPTVVVRYAGERAFGQLRHEPGTPDAYIVFIAPKLTANFTHTQESAWLYLLDALGHAAGRRGAHNIHAEVDEHSAMFEVLRRAGYASYARQDIWRRDPKPLPAPQHSISLRRAALDDMSTVRYLHAQTVPRLVHKADPVPADDGLVFLCEGSVHGFLSISAGNRGLYIRPYLSEERSDLAPAIFSRALWMLERATQVPVYCCVRQYQSWLGGTLEDLGFTPWAQQTVMVKHTSSRVEHPAFAPLPTVQNGITISGRPTSNCCAGEEYKRRVAMFTTIDN